MFSIIMYTLAIVGLIASYLSDKQKTKKALMKAFKSFTNMLPDFAGILALIGLVLTVMAPDTVSRILGSGSGFWGMILASIIGAVTLIPGFISFPLAASLLDKGAGVTQVAVFVSTLMMVGFVTLPLERKFFGKKASYMRNGLSYIYSFIVAIILGWVVTR